jgi:hypothetical protein
LEIITLATLFQPPTTAPVIAGESQPLAKRYFYQAGTTTPITVYTTSDLDVAHANPVVADSDGVFSPVWINEAVYSSYRVQLTTAADVLLEDEDDILTPSSTASIVSTVVQQIHPRTAREITASVVPTDYSYPEGNPYRYGAEGDGVADDTEAVQTAIDVASADDGGVVELDGDFLVGTLTLDASGVTIRGIGGDARLIANEDIPETGAILLSLAGGADATVNQALLDGVYGAAVQSVRTVTTGSLVDVHIDDVTFVGNAEAIRGVWMTGFTRGCRIHGCRFEEIDGDPICLNGSWSFSLSYNHIVGDDTNGTGMSLGRVGNGERSGSQVVNAPTIIGNEVEGHDSGCVWDFGSGGVVSGNRFEFNVTDGFKSQSVDGVAFIGNYLEQNAADNLQLGGTNGTDFCTGWLIAGNHFNNTSGGGNNIRLQGMTNCTIGPNNFSGSRTQHYFIGTGIGQYVTACHIWVPDNSATYISNQSELDLTDNVVYRTETTQRLSAPYIRGETQVQSGGTLYVGATGSLSTSCIAEFTSTTGAVLLPRMTSTERDALTATNGMLIYNTTTATVQARAGGSWTSL